MRLLLNYPTFVKDAHRRDGYGASNCGLGVYGTTTIHPQTSDLLPIGLMIWAVATLTPLFVAAQTPNQSPSASFSVTTEASISSSAVTWAESQLEGNFVGHVTSKKVQLQPWSGWCAKFVANAYGAPACGYESASKLWENIPNKMLQKVPDDAPKGLLVFWSWTNNKGEDMGGHVGIYVGNGQVISTAGSLKKPNCRDTIDYMDKKLTINGCKSQYLGYAPAPKNWPGPLLLRNSPVLDFGEVGIDGKGSKKTLTLVNAGTQPITVWLVLSPVAVEEEISPGNYKVKDTRLDHSIPPFSLTDEELKLSPGQSVEVGVRFDPNAIVDSNADVHFLVRSSQLNMKIGITSARVVGRGVKISETTLDLGNKVMMKLALIPAGKFMMGSPDEEADREAFNESPLHEVTIRKPFYMSIYVVTQEQYEQVMGRNPSYFKGAQNPVEMVSWDDAVEFCKKLSAKTGKKVRLPTEAEWEYACRAGSHSRFYFGDDDGTLGEYAWYTINGGGKPHPVGQKKPNAWGLYDMYGNVREWCADWYGVKYYGESPKIDPTGPVEGNLRVLRGGAWWYPPKGLRSAYRDCEKQGFNIDFSISFRVVVSTGMD